jgi:PAP2 superfamily
MRDLGRSICAASILLLAMLSAMGQQGGQVQNDLQRFADNVFHLSEVMLHDVTNPPAASRFYAYSILGAYETALMADHELMNINSRFNQNPNFKPVKIPKSFNLSFCANYAMLEVGRMIMPSGHLLEQNQNDLIDAFINSKRLTQHDINQNIRVAVDVAIQVINYAKSDGYNKLSTYVQYTPSKEEGRWYPTPPEYFGAIEPEWETIRPFFLESADQFSPQPPNAFSKDSTSSFYTQMHEVYTTVNGLNDERRLIANFWDCNPFAVTYSGHMAIGLKKISPGGHWMGIAGIACTTAGIPLDSAIFVHTVVAITLHDAFISCWKEKYLSDRIRPETIINKTIDPSWRPVLQTPPFPEYTSGHSVASASAAVILTHFLGDNFSFVDSTEVYFGLPDRHFNSFYAASDEAAISRLYGGIHFRDACEQGVMQGKKVGKYVLTRIFGANFDQE